MPGVKHLPSAELLSETTLMKVAVCLTSHVFRAAASSKHSKSQPRPSSITPSSSPTLLSFFFFFVLHNQNKKNCRICLKNLPLCFCRFLPASHPERQPAVLACLAGSTSSLLKAMNLKRQHVVGTTLGGSHAHTRTLTTLAETKFPFSRSAAVGL